MVENRVIKWGIMGPGVISSKFARDLAFAEGAVLATVGLRSLERAEMFAKKFNVQKAYGSYEELLQDPDVEIMYVGTLHSLIKSMCWPVCMRVKPCSARSRSPLMRRKPRRLCRGYPGEKSVRDGSDVDQVASGLS